LNIVFHDKEQIGGPKEQSSNKNPFVTDLKKNNLGIQ